MRVPELLAPAGNLEKGKAAVRFGADAIYLGGTRFNLRAKAGNFSREELEEMLAFAHSYNCKVYVTVNVFAHNPDLEDLPGYLKFLQELGVDAVIVADPGVLDVAAEFAPALPIHVSTQANVTNWRSARVWHKLGARRIILARELSLDEIKFIRENVQVELEVFVHGAMCISYSGRCLLSNYLAHRDANRGECIQACRFKYYLVEEKRPGQYMPVDEDERGTYIFNSRDLCLLGQIPQLLDAGVDSFKIEGRMKSLHYVATVVKVYREAIDAYLAHPEKYEVCPEWWEELEKISHRPYFTGFLFGRPGPAGQHYPRSQYERTHDFVAVVKDQRDGRLELQVRNRLQEGEQVEVLSPKARPVALTLSDMTDARTGEKLEASHAGYEVSVVSPRVKLEAGAIVRRQRPS